MSATFGDIVTRTIRIDTNLADQEYNAVSLDTLTEGVVNLAVAATAFVFPLSEGANGSVNEAVGTIVLSGRCKVRAGGVVAPGDKLTANGSGLWITTTTSNQYYGAIALEIGAANDIIEVLVVQGMVS